MVMLSSAPTKCGYLCLDKWLITELLDLTLIASRRLCLVNCRQAAVAVSDANGPNARQKVHCSKCAFLVASVGFFSCSAASSPCSELTCI